MNPQMSIRTTSRRHSGRVLQIVAVGLLLAITATTTWRATHSSSPDTAVGLTRPVVATAPAAATYTDATTGSSATPAQVAALTGDNPVVYIVTTQDEAEYVRGLSWAANQQGLSITIRSMDSDPNAAEKVASIQEARRRIGLSPALVIDMRAGG